MFFTRPLEEKDLSSIASIPHENLVGITNLPKTIHQLTRKMEISKESFAEKISSPSNEQYFFVLVHSKTKEICGVSGIFAESGRKNANIYKIDMVKNEETKSPLIRQSHRLLFPNPIEAHHSEIGALYIFPHFRHSGNGRLLSLMRLLFIAAFKERFQPSIVASMRGYFESNTFCPFWEGVGKHFCNLSFSEAMELLDSDPNVMRHALSKYPLYIDLLPKEVQSVIGKVHDETLPALKMLEGENFRFKEEIDPFDGGPLLISKASEIRTISKSIVAEVEIKEGPFESKELFIITNEKLNLRATMGFLSPLSPSKVLIEKEKADLLGISHGDRIRYVSTK